MDIIFYSYQYLFSFKKMHTGIFNMRVPIIAEKYTSFLYYSLHVLQAIM